MNYFDRPEVSNSDLKKLHDKLYPRPNYDPTDAYWFGTVLDAVVTEPERVDFDNKTVDGQQVNDIDWCHILEMKKSFDAEKLCSDILDISDPQKIIVRDMDFQYGDYSFTMPCRCKYDFYNPYVGADLKSTTAQTDEQFISACKHFMYFNQAYFYMNMGYLHKFLIIGISKINYNVFYVPIHIGSPEYEEGKTSVNELAFWYNTLM